MLDDSHAPSAGLPGPDPSSGPAPVADGPDAVARIARAHAPALRPAPARHRLLALLGPAFVAAVAYVDPGNVAANITAGARYGYALVWVLVLANVMAVLIQYQSAKLGIVTGRSLPQLLRSRLGHRSRLAFFAQAELVAVATDLAEVIGGAIALNLLVGTPLLVGGCIIGAISLLLLAVQQRRSQRTFEGLIIGLLVIVTIGFVGGLLAAPPDWGHVAHGLVPRLEGTDSLLVAASMLGATVMPHAIYLHSSLVRDHHGGTGEQAEPQNRDPAAGAAQAGSRDGVGKRRARIARLVRATRVDVVWALGLAGMVNIALLLLAASALSGAEGTDTIEGAHAAITASLGAGVGVVFAVGLLASGLASTSVGAYAGAEIMDGLLHVRIPILLQRLLTLIPALLILAAGTEPTWALVVSQVVLSFGIPFALVPLVGLTGSRPVMGRWRDGAALRWTSRGCAALIIALNLALIWLTLTGRG